MNSSSYEQLAEQLNDRGLDVADLELRLRGQQIETPSWAFGDSGTRFAVFPQDGAARSVFERIEDAAQVHKYTGTAPSVALHIPWDATHDYQALQAHAASFDMRLGAINANLFQESDYALGSVCNPDPEVRTKALEHLLECAEICETIGSGVLSLWLADGTNYPGQDSFGARRDRLTSTLSTLYERLPTNVELLIEYKHYEPAFYHTDLADWGSAVLLCQALGERAKVLIDVGHHAHGTNIEQIVALLLRVNRLGGLHLNDRKYGDDDLIVGSINPQELFLIYAELAQSQTPVRLTLDQSHNLEPKIEATIQSVLNLQETYARTLLIDRPALEEAQSAGQILEAHRILLDAYCTDVRPLCARVRESLDAAADPFAAFRTSGYRNRTAKTRTRATPPDLRT